MEDLRVLLGTCIWRSPQIPAPRAPCLRPPPTLRDRLVWDRSSRREVQQGLPDFADEEKERVGEEMADVLIYLVRMADVSGIDLSQAVVAKLQKNTEVRAGREAPAASRRMRKRDGARRSGRKPNGGGAGGD